MNNLIKWISLERLLSWGVFLLFARLCIGLSYYSSDYTSWGISDILINYEGGFVRRGLLGQILWFIEQIHLYDVRIAIMIICIISSFSILGVLLYIFKKEGWSLLIIPTGMCIGFNFLSLIGRRDFISLLVTFIIFICFNKIITYKNSIKERNKWWICFYLLSIFQILMHEASFFYTFPILMLLYYNINRISHKTTVKSFKTCLLSFLPIILTMLIVCIFKGNPNCAESIWASWQEVFAAYPSNVTNTIMGAGVSALKWNTTDAFMDHLYWSYAGYISPSYWRIIIVLFNFIVIYYLITRINMVDMGIYKKKSMDHHFMSNIVLVQFISMLPMFTVLSCDWGRTIPYWVISSLFFYHIFKGNYIPGLLPRKFQIIQHNISNNQFLHSPYTYMLLVLLVPVSTFYAPFDFYYNTNQQLFFYKIMNIYHQLIVLV